MHLLLHVAVVVAAVYVCAVAFLLVPAAVFDPVGAARWLVPAPLRAFLLRDPASTSWWCSVAAAVPFTAGLAALYVAGFSPMTTAEAVGGVIVTAISGGLVLLAAHRAAIEGADHWSLYGRRATRRRLRAACRSHVQAPVPGQLVRVPAQRAAPVHARPAAHRLDRQLRGWSRTLTGLAVLIMWIGRALQARGDVPAESAWWAVPACVVFLSLAVVWGIRGWRRGRAKRRSARSAGQGDVRQVLARMGMQVQLPGGNWARGIAPFVFAPKDLSRSVPWPWAGIATTPGGRTVVVTQHRGQLPGPALTSEVARTVCAVHLPGARLPLVVVTGREGVPLLKLRQSVPLELETFNRSLWAHAQDQRAVYALMHPRAMSEVLSTLPDGATVTFANDSIAVHSDEPVLPADLPSYVATALALADLIPTYLYAGRPAG